MSHRLLFVLPSKERSGGGDKVLHYANELSNHFGYATFVTSLTSLGDFTPEFGNSFEQLSISDVQNQDFTIVIGTHWSTMEFAASLQSRHVLHFAQSIEDRFFGPSHFIKQQQILASQTSVASVSVAPWMSEELKALSGLESTVVPNQFFDLPERTDQMENPLPLVILEGSWHWFKGWVDAVKILMSVQEPIQIAIVSSDGLLPVSAIRVLRRKFPSHQLVRYDQLLHVDFLSLLRRADVLLKTSCVEGSPLPHGEALASGCIVISTPATGVELSVLHGKTGLISDFHDTRGTAALIDLVIRDQELNKELREQGLAWIRRTQRSKASVERFAKVIEKKLMEPPQLTKLSDYDLHEDWFRYAEITFGPQILSRISNSISSLARWSVFRPVVRAIQNTSFGETIRRGLRLPQK